MLLYYSLDYLTMLEASAMLLRKNNFGKFVKILCGRVYREEVSGCNPVALIKINSTKNISHARASMHDYHRL